MPSMTAQMTPCRNKRIAFGLSKSEEQQVSTQAKAVNFSIKIEVTNSIISKATSEISRLEKQFPNLQSSLLISLGRRLFATGTFI